MSGDTGRGFDGSIHWRGPVVFCQGGTLNLRQGTYSVWVRGRELTESTLSVTPSMRVFISRKHIQLQYGDREARYTEERRVVVGSERPLQETACGARDRSSNLRQDVSEFFLFVF